MQVLTDLGFDGNLTLDGVANFYQVTPAQVQVVVLGHRSEFVRDGWRGARAAGCPDQWSAQAVIRAGLLLDRNAVTAQLSYLLGLAGVLPVVYSTSSDRLQECEMLRRKAFHIAWRVHEESTDELWRELSKADRYDLQASIIALAALVPDDRPGLQRWLCSLSGPQRSVAYGLALLVPQRLRVYGLRGRKRRTSVQSVQDSTLIDSVAQ